MEQVFQFAMEWVLYLGCNCAYYQCPEQKEIVLSSATTEI
jgi:hypothetical protein